LQSRRSGLKHYDFEPYAQAPPLNTWIGAVSGLESVALPQGTHSFDCRNNQLAWIALQQDKFLEAARAAVQRYGAPRVAVIIGTSTSGILHAELAYRARTPQSPQAPLPTHFHYRETLNNHSAPSFVAAVTGAQGPTYTISTACSSSAKVFAAAQRLIHAHIVDAAIVGGVDSLCLTTLCGFRALDLLSSDPCKPYDRYRNGISIGEGAGFALLERTPDTTANRAHAALCLWGVGESSDAHHMSTPHPQGLGAQRAMQAALDMAGLQPSDIDYINLHGTATRTNDLAEGRAVAAVFGTNVACSATKSWFGHLLGAAGIVESVVSLLALEHGLLPGTLNTEEPDPECQIPVLRDNVSRSINTALSNSFGFGGSNCSVLFGRTHKDTATC